MRTFLVAILALCCASMALATSLRRGIQTNLDTYVKAGVITSTEAAAIRERIVCGQLKDTFVLAGATGINYWVDQVGHLHSKRYAMEAFDTNEDGVGGREARTDGCHIWLKSCDNLFVPDQRVVKLPCPPPPAPCAPTVERVVERTRTIFVQCPPPPAPPVSAPCYPQGYAQAFNYGATVTLSQITVTGTWERFIQSESRTPCPAPPGPTPCPPLPPGVDHPPQPLPPVTW